MGNAGSNLILPLYCLKKSPLARGSIEYQLFAIWQANLFTCCIIFALSADFVLMCGLIVCSSAWQPTLRFDLREHRLQRGERVVGAPASRKWRYSVLQRGILERHTQSEPNHTCALCCPVQPAKVRALPHQRAGCHTGRHGQLHERDPEHHHTGRR